MHYKGSRAPLRQIAGELGVAHVLEGSVRRDGDRVRITAQLIDASTDQHLWSRSYDRHAVDVLGVQDEIAREVGRALEVTLGGAGWRGAGARYARPGGVRVLPARALPLAEAHEGGARPGGRVLPARDRARLHLRRRVRRARGRVPDRLRAVHPRLRRPRGGDVRQPQVGRRAGGRARRQLGPAHRALALLLWWQRDWPGAERELLRTLELNPGDAQARHWYAALLGLTGRIEDAVPERPPCLRAGPVQPDGQRPPTSIGSCSRVSTTARSSKSAERSRSTRATPLPIGCSASSTR